MSETIATINGSGQVTIPAAVRRHLGVGTADKVAFIIATEGAVELRPIRFTLESVLSSLPALPNESADLEREIEEAVTSAAARLSECP